MNNLIDENEIETSNTKNLFRPCTTKVLTLLYHQHPTSLDIDITDLITDEIKDNTQVNSDIILEVLDIIVRLIMKLELIYGEYEGNGVFKECHLTSAALEILSFPANRTDNLSITTGEQMLMALEDNNMQLAIDTLGDALLFDGKIH